MCSLRKLYFAANLFMCFFLFDSSYVSCLMISHIRCKPLGSQVSPPPLTTCLRAGVYVLACESSITVLDVLASVGAGGWIKCLNKKSLLELSVASLRHFKRNEGDDPHGVYTALRLISPLFFSLFCCSFFSFLTFSFEVVYSWCIAVCLVLFPFLPSFLRYLYFYFCFLALAPFCAPSLDKKFGSSYTSNVRICIHVRANE
ncbi:hypothetical protein Tb927.6.1150 [Trypanosoma brucei brucei TREU927]|uniref:Uncharacterized protein n=1 Tax=Trypanosoma brucei brucei (strain 927/4 GUTat10.1) TaxID=185431 RepID=Q585D2_TRYB2|nr:hypothetical protein Tb927.6.1150 [Trypanosoma brucei brucei TREU927]AAX80370.1 hypothetical protein Tb927.6.1150 [Trypanosoma brucei]AAZ11678.1 hypothetical protein Tb927.6.1150 [Trypanosoma brucei brucei TREU927]